MEMKKKIYLEDIWQNIPYLIKEKSVFGYEMRIAGGSAMTAVYAGINAKQKAFFAMLIGGGFAGLAFFLPSRA